MRKAPAPIAAVLLLLLVACAAEPPAPTPMATADLATPIPTVEPAAKPLLSELVISPDGLGPIRINEAYVPSDPATDVLVWDETWCDYPDGFDGAVDYPGWKSTYSGYSIAVSTDTREKTPGDPIREIVVSAPEVVTREGIGVGSPVSDVQAAYGSRVVELANDGYALRGAVSQLVFWWDQETGDTVGVMTVGQLSDSAYAPMTNGCN